MREDLQNYLTELEHRMLYGERDRFLHLFSQYEDFIRKSNAEKCIWSHDDLLDRHVTVSDYAKE